MELIVIKKIILIILGTLFLIVGTIGIVLPLIPTTPFLLLAATCYLNSSDKYYTMLINNKWFGKYIRDYREKHGIPRNTKIVAISLLWLTILASIIFVAQHPHLRIFLGVVAIGVTVHILRLKTLSEQIEDTKSEAGEREFNI